MESVDAIKARVQTNMTSGLYQKAAAECRAALHDSADDGLLWQYYGICCWHLGCRAEAFHALETASCVTPLEPLAQLVLGHLYVGAGHVESARAIFLHLARQRRLDVELLPLLAQGLGHVREEARALRICRRLVKARPMHHAAHFGVAFYRARLKYPARCLVRPLDRAVTLAPKLLSYRLSLALVWSELGRIEKALSLLQTIQPEQIDCPGCLQRLTQTLEQGGDQERAARWHRVWLQRQARAATPERPQ